MAIDPVVGEPVQITKEDRVKTQFHSTSDNLERLFIQFVQALFSHAGEKAVQGNVTTYSYPYVFFEKNVPEWALSSPDFFGLEHLRGVLRPSPFYYERLLAGYEEVEGTGEWSLSVYPWSHHLVLWSHYKTKWSHQTDHLDRPM